jgi:hypothetical protein
MSGTNEVDSPPKKLVNVRENSYLFSRPEGFDGNNEIGTMIASSILLILSRNVWILLVSIV